MLMMLDMALTVMRIRQKESLETTLRGIGTALSLCVAFLTRPLFGENQQDARDMPHDS